jgi:DNA-directed RNA polymerase specialized sigma24 family protein
LHTGLAKLTPGQQAVVTDVILDGRTLRETAMRLRIDFTSVRDRLDRAIRALERALL